MGITGCQHLITWVAASCSRCSGPATWSREQGRGVVGPATWSREVVPRWDIPIPHYGTSLDPTAERPLSRSGYTSPLTWAGTPRWSTVHCRASRGDGLLGSTSQNSLGRASWALLLSSFLFTFLRLISSSFPSHPRVRNERSDVMGATLGKTA